MADLIFLSVIGVLLGALLFWSFQHLPDERWQMLAVLPGRKQDNRHWQGTNLTYYGFFIATSQLLAVLLLLILLGAMQVSLAGTLLATAMLLAVCVPAARVLAILVEKKLHTFTIGGASFVGIVLAPFCIIAAREVLTGFFSCYLPLLPVMAAMAIAYTLGEGLGRLACLSFGCCYGKPLRDCRPFMRRFFAGTATVFHGPTKKAEYADKLAGEPLVPVQAMTCTLFTLTALVGCWLFLQGHFRATLVGCIAVTQLWRIFSEMLRADFRGFGKISAYQKMGGVAVLYICMIAFIPLTDTIVQPVILTGISRLWHPGVILCLQLSWLIFFLYFGRSTVTSATVSFAFREDRI